MSVKREKSAIEEIFKKTLEEAKKDKKENPFKKKKDDDDDDSDDASDDDHVENGEDSDTDDEDKSIDGQEDGKEEEDEEDKKIKKMKSKKKAGIKEETLAASSLHPAARSLSDPKAISASKIGMMQHMLGAMSSMNKGDLTDWFTKTMSQFGPGKTYGVGDNSSKNISTLNMKASNAVSTKGASSKDPMVTLDDKNNPLKSGSGLKFAVKEDVEEMFEGQDLSEEFKENISIIFEAAVNTKMIAETARLEEEYEEYILEEINSFKEDLTSKLDSYLDYVVENWMKENEVAIEGTLRNEVMEDFMKSIHEAFTENYLSVPQSKIDVVEQLTDKVSALEEKLNEVITENSELKGVVTESQFTEAFEEISSGLTLTQREKLAALAEGIEYNGEVGIFAKKLKIIKENYFKKDTKSHESNINEEVFEGELNESTTYVDPQINKYVNAITRTSKR